MVAPFGPPFGRRPEEPIERGRPTLQRRNTRGVDGAGPHVVRQGVSLAMQQVLPTSPPQLGLFRLWGLEVAPTDARGEVLEAKGVDQVLETLALREAVGPCTEEAKRPAYARPRGLEGTGVAIKAAGPPPLLARAPPRGVRLQGPLVSRLVNAVDAPVLEGRRAPTAPAKVILLEET